MPAYRGGNNPTAVVVVVVARRDPLFDSATRLVSEENQGTCVGAIVSVQQRIHIHKESHLFFWFCYSP
jgi:hypothetical protein